MLPESLGAWRLIPLFDAPGTVQMAVDQWLLREHGRQHQPSCLRFYTWSPAAISLGYHQRAWPKHWGQMATHCPGLDLVRRPTGGRAVLHQGDLTYSVVTSAFQGRRVDVYQAICQFLLEGWRVLGVPLVYGHRSRGYETTANCFSSPTAADLVMADGYKLIGSAQLKRDRAVLQHGSMRLHPDVALYEKVFAAPLTVPTFPDHLQHLPTPDLYQMLIEALTQAARRYFSKDWVVQPLSKAELDCAIACFGQHPPV